MSIAVTVLLSCLGALLALLIGLAVTPVRIRFVASASPSWRLRVGARLFGGLMPTIPVYDSARRDAPTRKQPAQPDAGRRKARPAPHKDHGLIPRMLRAAPRLAFELLGTIHLTRLAVDADVELADPADTGQLYGLLAPFLYGRSHADSLNLRPDFTGPRLEGRALAELSVIPAAFVPPGVRFAWRVYGPRS